MFARFLPLTALAVLLAAPAVRADAKSLAGTYEIKGTNPAGQDYSGTVEIEFEKGNTVKITWKIGKKTDIGLGHLDGDKLTVKYVGAVQNRKGNCVYDVKKNGRLVGTFHEDGGKPGKETLIPRSR